MYQIMFTLEYLWVHFAVYARAFTESVRGVHRSIGVYA